MRLWVVWYRTTLHRNLPTISCIYVTGCAAVFVLAVIALVLYSFYPCLIGASEVSLMLTLMMVTIISSIVATTATIGLIGPDVVPNPHPPCIVATSVSVDVLIIVDVVIHGAIPAMDICDTMQWLRFIFLGLWVASFILEVVLEGSLKCIEEWDTYTIDQGETTEEEDDTTNQCCPICLRSVQRGRVEQLECTHTFHTRCIERWLLTSNTQQCPMCKHPTRRYRQVFSRARLSSQA